MASIPGGIGSRNNMSRQVTGDSSPLDAVETEVRRLQELSLKLTGKQLEDEYKVRKQLQEKFQKEKTKQEKKDLEELYKFEHQKLSKLKDTGKAVAKAIGDALGKALTKSIGAMTNSIDSYISTYTKYMGTMTTRLQGTSLTYNRLMQDVSRGIGVSPYLKQTDMIENLNKFVETGITYNLETRAYIATATNKIATTFNAFDSSLLRIIKIQQADSTVARIGMESLLTKFLNTRYGDTSYLNQTSKGVSSALLEAESLMGVKGSTEFEYAVQRWLGSMSSLGVSENTISSLATGLGYLGSGNISALQGNTALRNLLFMAASRGGMDIGSLLTGGITGSQASALLSQVVGIGQNIASSGSNVVKSQFAQLFGLSVSDLVSLTNITASDIKEITKNIVNYEQLRNETANQLATMSQRTTISEKVSNVFSNLLTGAGANIATNPAAYAIWEAANMMQASGLDTTINLGFLGTGTSFTTSQAMKAGVGGLSVIASLMSGLGYLGSNGGGTSLNIWGEQPSRRGDTLSASGFNSGRTVSASTYIGTMEAGSLGASGSAALQEQAQTYAGEQADDKLTEEVRMSISPNIAAILGILQKWDNSTIGMFGLNV